MRFNLVKSQLMTFGGSNPDNKTVGLYLDRKVVQLCTKVKYLCLYLISGADFKIDLTATKRKYYGCFNTIMSVVGNQVNEIMALHLVNSHCPPQLIMHAYGCEIWPLNSGNIREIDIIWNNGFRRIFNCCWRESVKPLQFYCRTLQISYLVGERQLLFYKSLFCRDNIVLHWLDSYVLKC